jgi:chromosome segregation ATPase
MILDLLAEMGIMAKAIPNPERSTNGTSHQQLLHDFHEERANRHLQAANGAPHLSNLEFWGEENPLASGAEELAAQDPELLKTLGISAAGTTAGPASETDALLAENAELREIIAELKTQVEETEQRVQAQFADRNKEYDQMLEEKSQIIRDLHVKIQELEARPPVPVTPKEEELIALSEELERERCQLQQDRRTLEEERKQLAEDEEIMTQQMREMEVQMARERADFARQRSELNRIQDEIRRELENIERNGLLNQRLGQLRQRSTEVSVAKGSGLYRQAVEAQAAEAGAPPEAANGQEEPRRRESFLGRLFG